MLAICWDHWRPISWTRWFPFEVFLFFFLVMTGYLITGSLLRERDRSEARGGAWKMKAMRIYQIRRGLRILAPYYAALGLALLVMAPDVWAAPLWYVFHVSNIHMAFLPAWPPGTNHFWSLSMQQQFYLIWPFVIWILPRKSLLWFLLAWSAVGPLTRLNHDGFAELCARPEVLTWASFDYFGIGALLALAVHRGMKLESPGLRWIAGAAGVVYLAFFTAHAMGWPTFGLRSLQQSFLAIALCGVIAAGSVGFSGNFGRVLQTPFLQKVGALSYGIYLYHNLAPLLAGKLLWFLWGPSFQAPVWDWVRILSFAAFTWLLAAASWKWIEQPLQGIRSKISPPNP